MKKEQFLDIMDEIGDDLIEDFLDIPGKRFSAPKKTPLWKIGLSAAAAVCVVAAGVFGVLKLRGLPHSPNESAIISNSAGASGSVSEISETSSERLGLLEREAGGEFEFRILEGDQNPVYTKTVTKKDNEQYATLEIKFRGALLLSVYRDDTRSCIGRTTIDDGGGTFTLFIDYLEEVKEGEDLYLSIYALENSVIEGKWAP